MEFRRGVMAVPGKDNSASLLGFQKPKRFRLTSLTERFFWEIYNLGPLRVYSFFKFLSFFSGTHHISVGQSTT